MNELSNSSFEEFGQQIHQNDSQSKSPRDDRLSMSPTRQIQSDTNSFDHANGIPTFDAIAQVVTSSESKHSVHHISNDIAFQQQLDQGHDNVNSSLSHSHNMMEHVLYTEEDGTDSDKKFLPSLYLPPQADEPSSYLSPSFPRVRRWSQEESARNPTSNRDEDRFQPVFSISSQGRSFASCVKPMMSLAFVLAFLELGSAFFLFTRGSRATTFIGAFTVAFAVSSGALALAGNLGLSLYLNASRIPRSLFKSNSYVRTAFYSLGSSTIVGGNEAQEHQVQRVKDPKKIRFERRNAEQSIQSSSLLTFFLAAGAHLVALKSVFAIAVLVLSESHPGYLVHDWFGNDPASSSYLNNQKAFSGTAPMSYSRRGNMEQAGGWFSLSFARSDLNYVAAQAAAEGLSRPSDDLSSIDTLSALEATASAATLLAGSISLASCVSLAACLIFIRLRVNFPVDSLQVFLSNALFLGLSGVSLVATTARLRATPAEIAAMGHSLESDVSFSYSLGLFTLVVACLAVRRASGWYYIESRRTDVNVDSQAKALTQVVLSLSQSQSQPKKECFSEQSHLNLSGVAEDKTVSETIRSNQNGSALDDDIAAAALTYDAIMREFDEMGQELGAKTKSSRVSAVADALSKKEAGAGSGFTNWSSSIDSDKVSNYLSSCGRCCKSCWSGVEAIGKGRTRNHRFGMSSSANGKVSASSSHSLEAVLHKVTSSVLFFLSFLCLSFVLGRMIDLVDVLPYASVIDTKSSTASQPFKTLNVNGANMFSSGGHGNSDAFDYSENGERSSFAEYDEPSFRGDAMDFKHGSESVLRNSIAPTRTVRTFTLLSLQGEGEAEYEREENVLSDFENSPSFLDVAKTKEKSFNQIEQEANEELTGQEADEYRVFLLMLLASLTVLSLFSAFSTFLAFKVNDWATVPSLNHRSVDWFKRNSALRL